jgi:membrane-associated protease RseP (regulator of RpoE activity)
MSEPNPPLVTYQLYPPVEVFVAQPLKRRYWLHALLLLLTMLTTTVVGARMQYNFNSGLPTFSEDSLFPLWALQSPSRLLMGLPFSATLLAILLAHEMGHFFFCARYGVNATLPFFIPAPTLIGTFGAFIRIRSPIRSRAQLFDIGIAGPIAGFVVAVAVLIIALPFSIPAAPTVDSAAIPIGYPLVFYAVQWLLAAGAPAGSAIHLPLGDLNLHPMALAAWVGMLATALNLLPGGQLDGGHIVYAVAPRLHRRISRLTAGALVLLAWLWSGWVVWAVLLLATGTRHPAVPSTEALSPRRRLLAVFALVMLVLSLIPTPFHGIGLYDFLQQLLRRGAA